MYNRLKKLLALMLAAVLALGLMEDVALSDTQSSDSIIVSIVSAQEEPEVLEKTITVYANFPGDGDVPENRTAFFTQTFKSTDKAFKIGTASTNFKSIYQGSRLECVGFSTSASATVDRIDGGMTLSSFEEVLQLADTYYALWNYKTSVGKTSRFSPGWPKGTYSGYQHPYTSGDNPNSDKYPLVLWNEDEGGTYLIMPDPNGYGYTIRSDYAFIGWAQNRNGKPTLYQSGDKVYKPASGGYYACYEKKVQFHHNNSGDKTSVVLTRWTGGNDDALNNGQGYALTFPAAPQREGYTFSGWSGNADGDGKLYQPGDAANLRGESDYYAVWEANPEAEYTVVRYEVGVTDAISSEKVTATTGGRLAGSELAQERPMEGFRYVFSEPEEATVEADNSTIVRLYYKRLHTVSYQYEGTVPNGAPEVPAQAEAVSGESIKIDSANRAVSGFTWSGWRAPDGITITDGAFEMPESDVVLSGGWTADVDELTVNSIDGYYRGAAYELVVDGMQRGDSAYLTINDTRELMEKGKASFVDSVEASATVEVERDGHVVWTKPTNISIKPRRLSFEVDSRSFVYNARPQSVTLVETTPDEPDNGYGTAKRERVVVTLNEADTTQTFVTNGPVTVGAEGGYAIGYENGAKAENYQVTVENGFIEITRRPVTLVAPSGDFDYNAQEHALAAEKITTADGAGFLDDVDGVLIAFANTADGLPSNARRVPGQQAVTLDMSTLELTAAAGFEDADLMAQYDVSAQDGLLTVNAAQGALVLTLTALDAQAMYDGTEHAVLATDANAYTVEGLPEGVRLEGIGAVASGVYAGDHEIGFEGTALLTDTTVTPAADVTECFAVKTKTGTMNISKRPIRLIVGSVTHAHDGMSREVTCAAGKATDKDGIEIGGLAQGDTLNAVLNGNGRTDVGTSKVTIDRKKTTIMNGATDATDSYDVVSWGEGSIVITAADASYTVRYYYDGQLDADETETHAGKEGDVINTYTSKSRAGMRLDHTRGLPLTLAAGSSGNEIRVYYETREETELIVEVETPLAGTMMSVTVGDTIE